MLMVSIKLNELSHYIMCYFHFDWFNKKRPDWLNSILTSSALISICFTFYLIGPITCVEIHCFSMTTISLMK